MWWAVSCSLRRDKGEVQGNNIPRSRSPSENTQGAQGVDSRGKGEMSGQSLSRGVAVKTRAGHSSLATLNSLSKL